MCDVKPRVCACLLVGMPVRTYAVASRNVTHVVGVGAWALQAIKLKPRFCDAYNNLASVHMHLGNSKQAIETYQMALMLNPALVDAHSNLGNLYKAQVGREPVVQCCTAQLFATQSLSHRTPPVTLHSLFHHAPLTAYRATRALDAFRSWQRRSPDRLVANFTAVCLAWLPLLCLADAQWERSFLVCMGTMVATLGLCLCVGAMVVSLPQGALEDAKKCYMEAIRLRPDFAIAWSNLAGAWACVASSDAAAAAVHCS
jgi:tetratricopeptide (TPR) repeat protein